MNLLQIIVGAVVETILAFVLGFFAKDLWHKVKKRDLAKFWQPLLKDGVVFVVPWADVDPQLKGTQVWDWMGTMELLEFFRKDFKPPFVKCVLSNPSPDSATKQNNMILVGGWIPNPLTEEVFQGSEIVYHFGGADRHAIQSRRDEGFSREAKWNADHTMVTKDYGIITCIKNPYNHQEVRYILVGCGCWGWGTFSALVLMTDPKVVKYLLGKGRCFQALCTCDVGADRLPINIGLLDFEKGAPHHVTRILLQEER